MSEKINNPGVESLVFKPSKVSWAINSFLINNDGKFERLFILSILAVTFSFLLWSWNSTKAIVVDSPGELVTKTPPVPVSLSTSVKIKKILISNNAKVKKGEMLLHLDSYIAPTDIKLIQDTMNLLKTNVESEKARTCKEDCLQAIRILAERGMPFINKVESNADFYRELNELSRILKDYQTQLNYVSQLPSTTASIQNEIQNANKKINAILAKRAEKILSYELEELRNKVIHLQTQYKEKVLSVQSTLEASRNTLEVMLAKIPKSLTEYTANSTVTSPGEGLLTYAELKGEGQLVNPGQPIFLLHSSTAQLKVNLKLPDTEISKVRPGMPVRLDINSYPASEYGVQEAVITDIPEKVHDKNAQKDNYFDVFAELRNPAIELRGKVYQYRAGMTVKAKIIVKHERVLTYYYKKLLSIKDDVLGD